MVSWLMQIRIATSFGVDLSSDANVRLLEVDTSFQAGYSQCSGNITSTEHILSYFLDCPHTRKIAQQTS
jgi:hypothetical protein